MTKTSILTLTALSLLVACSKDSGSDHDETNQAPISFKSNELAPEASMRAVGLETRGVEAFYVWSYKTKSKSGDSYNGLQTIMEQYKVQWTVNTAGSTTTNVADWEYVGITDHGQKQNIKYWDMQATSYRFFGIAPAQTSNIISYQKNTQETEYDITFMADASKPQEAPYISKLWITNNNPADFPSRHYRDMVTMEFMKPVTKVRIELIDDKGQLIVDPEAQGITAMNFAPANGGNIIYKGQLKVSYPLQGTITFTQYLPTLTIVGDTSGSLKINRTKAISNSAADDYADWYNVLPHIEQDAFQFSLTIGGKSRMATVPAKLMSWNPNMEYTYKFKLTASDVQFIDIVQIGVTEWTTQNVKYEIYNW